MERKNAMSDALRVYLSHFHHHMQTSAVKKKIQRAPNATRMPRSERKVWMLLLEWHGRKAS
jgi:hypothetical protein